MQSMTKKKQTGTISAIAVFFLIVVIGGMVTIAVTMSTSSLSDINQQNNKSQAMYLAESALERVVFNLNNDPDCNNLASPDQQSLGNGIFEITSVSIIDPIAECDIKVKATAGDIVFYINAKLVNKGGVGGGAGTDFQEQFPSNTDFTSNWLETIINGRNKGTSRWDAANCPSATCSGSAGGSFYVETNGSGGSRRMHGYRERNIINPVNTGASGMKVTLTGAWLKQSSTGGTPRRQVLKIRLYDSTNAVTKTLWSNNSKSGNSGIQLINKNINLAANRIFDKVQVFFNFTGRKSGGVYVHPQAYVDEISITGIGSGGAAPDWQIVEWQEVDS